MLSLIAVAGLAHADLRSELLASHHQEEKAMIAKDKKRVEEVLKAILTPDFQYVQYGKPQDTKTFIGNTIAGIDMVNRVTTSSMRIISLKNNGSSGTGKVELSMTGTMKGQDKKDHTVDYKGLFNEKYRKIGGKWKISEMVQGAQKFLMDGKPVKM